jgi:hypothetical protein
MKLETKDITQHRLRNILFDCIEELRAGTMDVEKAKMVNEIARSINTQANLQLRAAETFNNVENDGIFELQTAKRLKL